MQPLHIVLIGAQGSGKGTQGELLSKHLGIPTISPGALYRKHIAEGTDIGKEVQARIASGQLAEDATTKKVIAERLMQSDVQRGFILDGYPRNAVQQRDLDEITPITHVFVIQISDEEAVRRITGRRQCKNNHIYHLAFNPPKIEGICDGDNEPLIQRADDTEEAVKKRLGIYHNETKPLIDIYRDRGLVHDIDGAQPIEVVQQTILQELGVSSSS